MIRQIFLGLLSLLTIPCFAQPDPIGNFNKHVIEKWSEDYVRVSQYRVKGSPFLLGESFDGELTMQTGLKTFNQKVLYNIMDQRVGTEINKQMIAPDGDVTSFYIQLPEKFGGEKLNFLSAESFGKNNVKGFLNVIADGSKVAFLRQYRIRLAQDPENMYTKDIRIFEQYYEYYIYLKETNKLIKVRLKEKEIVSSLSGFAVPANADFSSVFGVKKVIEHLNK